MKKIAAFLIAGLLACISAFSQQIAKPSPAVIAALPQWAQEMYSDDPNVFRTDSLYNEYYSTHPFVQTSHTAYYRIWRHANIQYVNAEGYIRKPSAADQLQKRNALRYNTSSSASAWTLVGPEKVFATDGSRTGEQTNIYSFTQCQSHPNYLYAGTEPGEIYRSSDGGSNWQLCTLNDPLGGSVSAICVSPTDSSIVYAGSGDFIFKSSDGGNTWNAVFATGGLWANEILVHPADPNVVLVAANKGFFKTTDGGATWTTVYTQSCWDVKLRPGTGNVVYLVKDNPSQLKAEFFLSSDTGSTFTIQSNGWYNSTDPARQDGGARIAVSPADPARVYAYLIGQSKANDYGFIGVYRSNDGGATWTLPNGPDGGPYTSTHLNLAYGTPSWTYDQGFYNCAIMADPNNADAILIGGLNLWKSTDGGASFTSVAGYIGGPLNIHVDQQDFRVGVGGVWVTNDGGIYFSNDFFSSDNEVKMDGIHGSEFWGFGEGWNDDVMVGGLYHNGVVAYDEDYGANNYLQLGGGEPASGYVNPGINKKVYSSEIGGAILPDAIGQPVQYLTLGMSPNESYWTANSSEMEFDPRCYNIAWIGNANKLYRSTDGGGSFNLVYTFGTNTSANLSYFEISMSNPDVMYVTQQPASGNQGKIWKTTDGGITFTQLTIPAGNSSRIIITLSPTSSDSLWIGYPSNGNGSKIFRSGDGGATWTNYTTSDLDNQEVRSIQCIGATNGGVYLATDQTVYYRNNTMGSWMPDNSGLPAELNSLYLRPFYRDSKIKISSYGHGVWENSLIDPPSHPVAQPQVDKLNYTMNCVMDTFYFEDHSIINHAGASWQWSFPGGSPAASTLRNPKVVYPAPGTYTATLIVTDNTGQHDTGSVVITITPYAINNYLAEGFETSFPPNGWFLYDPDGDVQWSLANNAGGYGQTAQSAVFDNYDFDSQGHDDDLRIRTDMTQQSTHWLKFDRAYSLYGAPYSDTLEVLVSTDCGATFTSLYLKGGSQLATAPSLQSSTYVPAASEWATDSIDLSAWASSTDLMIAFRNHGYFGQALYIDNINLSAMTGIHEQPSSAGNAMLVPNPVAAGQALVLQSDVAEKFTVEIFDPEGRLILREQHMPGDHIALPANGTLPGVYFYRLTSDTMIRNSSFIVR
ncbi:MAG TPA: PKD domain-containing protein [Bacteroidia bacterium]|nr:PKD domain-containing protein [Bacteroidia bacterium]